LGTAIEKQAQLVAWSPKERGQVYDEAQPLVLVSVEVVRYGAPPLPFGVPFVVPLGEPIGGTSVSKFKYVPVYPGIRIPPTTGCAGTNVTSSPAPGGLLSFAVETTPWSEFSVALVAGMSGISRPVRSPPGVSGPVTVASEGGEPLAGRALESVTTTKELGDP
jgi:hypothetical protein